MLETGRPPSTINQSGLLLSFLRHANPALPDPDRSGSPQIDGLWNQAPSYGRLISWPPDVEALGVLIR